MTEHIATTAYGWGRGHSQDQALYGAIMNTRPDDDTTVRLVVWCVEGFNDVYPFGIDADELVWEDKYDVPGAEWNELRETIGQLERQIEDTLVDARIDEDEE